MTASTPTQSRPVHEAATQRVDNAVQALLADFYAGHKDEQTVRYEISGYLKATRASESVAWDNRLRLNTQQRVDLSERLGALLMDKVIDAKKAGGYDLRAGRGASFSGWAKQFAKAAALSEVRNLGADERMHGSLCHDPDLDLDRTHRDTTLEESITAQVMGEVLDRFDAASQHSRGGARVYLAASNLAAAFNLTLAVRPAEMEDRDALYPLLMANPTLAYESLVAWANLAYGSDPSQIDPGIEDRLMMLWDDQDRSSTRRLLDLPEGVAYILAVAAVQPRPRPAANDIRAFRAVARTCGPARRDWQQLAAALADAFIDTEVSAVASGAKGKTEASVAAAEKGHALSRGKFAELAERAARYDGAPFGNSVLRVREALVALAIETGIFPADTPLSV